MYGHIGIRTRGKSLCRYVAVLWFSILMSKALLWSELYWVRIVRFWNIREGVGMPYFPWIRGL